MEKAYDISHLEHTNDKYDGLQKIEASGTGDVALKLVSHTHGLTLSRAEEKGYLRRVDLVLMPLMFITFGLQYMDKSLLSAAAQSGIIQDLHLYTVDSQGLNLMRYSYCTMIFYWGYFTGAFPAAYLSQRAPLGRYAGIAIAVWGAITLATVGVKSYGGFLVQRFFLGFTEAAISPAFSLITAMWYKRDEQPLRIAIWYSSTGFGGLVGSLVTYGIGHIKGPLAPWKYQYLIIGSITVIWGFLIFFLLPNNPLAAWFLNQNHRILAVHRMKAEQTGLENKRFKWYQAREALLDPKNWLLVLMTLCTHMVNGGVSGFGTIIVRSFGYSPLKSVLMVGCVGVVVLGSLLISGFVSVYIQDMRVYIAVVCSMFVIAGASAIWKLSWASHAGPMAGFCILGFFAVSYVMILALMNANTAGHTKKAVTAGMIWAAYCVANGVSPLLILAPEEPTHYPTEFKTIIGALSANICIGLGLRFYLARENKSRNTVSLAEGQDLELTAYADLTDRENPNFRFCL